MIFVTLSEEQIKSTANDAELGTLVRKLYYEQKEDLVKWIDPPSGWKYGFPKPIPENITNTIEWLVENGYPETEIEKLGEYFFCRYYYAPKTPDKLSIS